MVTIAKATASPLLKVYDGFDTEVLLEMQREYAAGQIGTTDREFYGARLEVIAFILKSRGVPVDGLPFGGVTA